MRHFIAIGGFLAASALAGCQMLDSRWVDSEPAQPGATCHSNAGSYHLPRKLIVVSVMTGEGKVPYSIKIDKKGSYVADRSETYCLDFLLSYLSADRVGIQRTADGLLQRVYTQADDKTEQIAKKLIDAAADLVASQRADSLARSSAFRPQFKDNGEAVLATFEFDPFVEREAREVNYALKEFGFCLYLDSRNDVFAPRWSEDICREIRDPRSKNPREAQKRGPSMVYKAYPRSGLPIFDPRPVPEILQALGVLYRPELTHSLVVIRKPDPGSRFSEWRPVASDRIVMPNAAPAFILGVERAIFVKADTDVQFENGLIRNISINKPSELLVAADIAVYAAQVVVNIPTAALKIFNNRAENTIQLMQTNADLIETLRTHKADVNLEAFGPAAAQAQANSGLILGRDPMRARLEACLADPAAKASADGPLKYCRDLLEKGF